MFLQKTGRLGVLIPLVASSLLLVGCSGGASTAGAQPGKQESIKIAAFVLATANAYAQNNIVGIKAAAAGNAEVTVFDGAFDGNKQLGQIQDAVASGKYDGFVVFPNDSAAVVPGVESAAADGIPVVAAYAPIGSDVNQPEPQIKGVIGTVWHPNQADGKALGELVVTACKEKHPQAAPCKVAYISGGNSVLFEQIKLESFKKAVKESGAAIEIVAQQEGNFLIDASRTATENILQAHPDVNVISTSADQMTLGAGQGVDDSGIKGITLIGVGASEEGVQAVKAGKWFGTTVFLPEDEGRLATQMLLDHIGGKPQEKTVINVVDGSPIGGVFTQNTTKNFTPQWSAVG